MKRFRFGLEPVRRFRKRIEDEKRRDLGKAVQTREAHAGLLRWLDDERGRVEEEARVARSPTAGFDVRAVAGWERYRLALGRRRAHEDKVAEKLGEVVEKRRLALVEARRGREALELLRKRQLGEWRREVDRAEVRELDEVASRCGRGAGSSPTFRQARTSHEDTEGRRSGRSRMLGIER